MLTAIDRVQMAVPDAGRVAALWQGILGAEPAGQDRLALLGAKRTALRLGRGWLELLEPDPFVSMPRPPRLGRFSRYWRDAEPVVWDGF